MKFCDPPRLFGLVLLVAGSACVGAVGESVNDDGSDGVPAGGGAVGGRGAVGGGIPSAAGGASPLAGRSGGSAGERASGSGGAGGAQEGGPGGPQGGGSDASAGSGGMVRDGGAAGAPSTATKSDASGAPAPQGGGNPTAGKVPAVVAVGYGGLRLVSRDGGKTWGNRQILARTGGDDPNLLRGVNWADGLFIAVGWKLFTSEDGVTWTERVKRGLHDCATFANGAFYVKNVRGDDTQVSKDRGVTWVETSERVNCTSNFEQFDSGSAHLRAVWQGEIERSENGQRFQSVYKDPDNNHPNAFASGWVSP